MLWSGASRPMRKTKCRSPQNPETHKAPEQNSRTGLLNLDITHQQSLFGIRSLQNSRNPGQLNYKSSSGSESATHKAAENLKYMNYASLPSYSQHKTETKPTTCESIVTNMNNGARMAPPVPEMVSTASLYNLGGSLNDSNQSHMNNPNGNHQALNPSVYGAPFQPYMQMNYLFRPPNLNRNHMFCAK